MKTKKQLEKAKEIFAFHNQKRSNESKQKIHDTIENWDFNEFGKITQKKIYSNFPVSKNTVKKHWHIYKSHVKELNDEFKK